MRRIAWLGRVSMLFSMLFSVLLFSVSAVAQSGRVPGVLEGTWRRRVNDAQARSLVLSAFEPRLTRFPEFLRGVARDRITAGMQMAPRVQVGLDAERVRVTYFYERPVRIDTTLGGSDDVRAMDGHVDHVVQRLRGGWLEQVFTNDDGRVHHLLSTEPDGSTLHIDYTVYNDRLGDPVRWRVDYTR